MTIYATCGAGNDAVALATNLPSGSLLGYELGNEADLNSPGLSGVTWNYQNYLAAYQAVTTNVQQMVAAIAPSNSALPTGANRAIMQGPGWAVYNDTDKFTYYLPSFITSEHATLNGVNEHFYAGNASSVSDFLMLPASVAPTDHPAFPVELQNLNGTHVIALARSQYNLPIRMGEFNSTNGGGVAGIGDRFQAALWMLDQGLQYAQYGVDGINVYTTQGVLFTPFEFAHAGTFPNITYSITRVGPIHYGMLMLQQFLQNNASLLTLSPANRSGYVLSEYATVDTADTIRVLLINKNHTLTSSGDCVPKDVGDDINISVPSSGSVTYGAASLTYLKVSNSDCKSADYSSPTTGTWPQENNNPTDVVTIGGQTFKNSTDGKIQGTVSLPKLSPTVSAGINT